MDETPTAPETVTQQPVAPPQPAAPAPDDAHRGRRIGGIILILLGLFFYAQQFLPALSWAILWPAVLIVAGIYILLKGKRS